MVPQEHWGSEYSAATRLHTDVLGLFKRYLDAGQEEARAHSKHLSGDEVEGGDTQWYIDWAVKDAKKHVSDIRSKIKEFAMAVKQIQKQPVRRIGQGR